jgi:hypothetical protein
MKFTYVGTRWMGGPEWPPYNGVMECSDEEAAKLVNQGNAVYLEDEPEPVTAGFAPLKKWVEDYDPVLDPDNYKDEDQELTEYEADELAEAEDEGPKRPATYANKPEWVKYAIAKGEDPDVAARMGKADLVSKYGASL